MPSSDKQGRQDIPCSMHDVRSVGKVIDDGEALWKRLLRLRSLQLLDLLLLVAHDLKERLLVPIAVETGGSQTLGKVTHRIPGTVDVHTWGEDVDLIKDLAVRAQE